MKILLVAMPDSASCFDHIMELPNLGLCCLAGNLDGGHEVRILDLVKHRKHVGRRWSGSSGNTPPTWWESPPCRSRSARRARPPR